MRLLAPWFASDEAEALTGQRVELRAPAMDQFEQWRELRLASRAFLEPWEPTWDEAESTRASFAARVKLCRQLDNDDHGYAYFIFRRDTGALCGGITLSNVRRGVAQTGTLGYWIGLPHVRRHLMTDAITVLVGHAFNELKLHRVEAACLPRNAASLGLLDKCGFEKEGYAASYLKIAGRWEDHVLLAKVNGRQA